MQLFTDPLNLRRVKTEISLLKIIRHKNIIKLYEVIETPQKIYLIMEFCEGGELFDYIVKKDNLTERQSCHFFHEIIEALDYLHSLNIVHRDLKPENLLIEKINKKLSLKLIDFGISNTYTDQSLLMTPCGTASYAPPEMHKGEKYYGLLTDIWSAGVVLYAMVFGYLPFCEDDEETNINNIVHGNYEIPSSASPELYDLLLHLLDINPITRYDIDQIKMHPWYNLISSDSERPGLIIGYHKIPVDERIINVCKTYGYDPERVRESVYNNNFDNNSSIYYIILNKMKAMGIESISDLNSIEYLNYITDPNNILFNIQNSNNKILFTDNDDLINNNLFLSNMNNKNKLKYENITPSSIIQFTIKAQFNHKKAILDKMKTKDKNYIKYKEKKKNSLEIKNNFNFNLYDKKNKLNNSNLKNNNHKKIITAIKKINNEKRRIINMSQIINNISSDQNKKKESIKSIKSIKSQKNNGNNLVLQANKTFSIDSKCKINKDNLRQIMKKNESFDKKLTDDIKEKILKLRNPKINTKKHKAKEIQLKLQLKIKKENKNSLNNKKIGQKISIFNKDRKKHTVIHNRNASARQNRYNKHKNNININYINNNINITNIYVKKIREQSSSPPKRHIKNNSSIIKYQKIGKNQQNLLNYTKNDYSDENNISIISKINTLDKIEAYNNDGNILNKSSKKFKNKKNDSKERLSGCKNIFKDLLKFIDNKILCQSARNRNSSLTSRRDKKKNNQSTHFISYMNKNNNLTAKKRLNNQRNLILKKSYLNDTNFNKKNNLYNTTFNCNFNYNKLKNDNSKTKKKEKDKKINIKKKIFNNEVKQKYLETKRPNKLMNCISPIHQNNLQFFNLPKRKSKNEENIMSKSTILNNNRRAKHKKCSSMKSDSFNFDFNIILNSNINNFNKSFREREIKREKDNSKNKSINYRKKRNIQNKKMDLTLKYKYNKEMNNNYKSNYILKKNVYYPKKYNGPIDFKNIVSSFSGMDICDELEDILKKKKISVNRINPYKMICWKNLEIIEISIYLISGNIINNNIKSYNILDLDSKNLEVKYNNTFAGMGKKEEYEEINSYFRNKNNKRNKKNIYYINILSKEKKSNSKFLFDTINKIVYNKYYAVKYSKI